LTVLLANVLVLLHAPKGLSCNAYDLLTYVLHLFRAHTWADLVEPYFENSPGISMMGFRVPAWMSPGLSDGAVYNLVAKSEITGTLFSAFATNPDRRLAS
jgi:hypothetical protein